MENLNCFNVRENVEILLKNGQTLIGSIPFDTSSDHSILFLDYSRRKEFNNTFQVGTMIRFEDVKDFVQIIMKKDIKSYRKFSNVCHGVRNHSKKKLPDGLEMEIFNNGKPGHLDVRYKIPGSSNFVDLGELRLNDGFIELPITLVFLSYPKEEKDAVKTIMQKLHNRGVMTWFDEHDLLPGDKWEDKIEEGIESADFVFIFFSSNSMDRDGYKNKELHLVLKQYQQKPFGKRFIIPIILDDCVPPRELKEFQYLKITDENWEEKLMKSIGTSFN